ncbi:MAG: hypothetical protein GY853_04455 [PVC group bacterium]|nr:hypothetical protein [PVC group bacterium]
MKRIFRLLVFVLCLCLIGVLTPLPMLLAQATYEIEDDADISESELEDDGLVSLDFKDANLKDVLKVFSQQSGLNFVATQNIQDRPVTLYMEEVKVENALQALLASNNLGLEQSPGSNIIIVKAQPVPPVQTKTKVYKMRYFHGNVSPGQYLMQKGSVAQGSGMNWEAIIRPLLSEVGTLVNYANLLVITDVPARFKLIDQVIAEIDRPIPEVMLEVELIETTSDFLKDVGVKWGKEFAKFTGPSTISSMPYAHWKKPGNEGYMLPSSMADGTRFQYGLMSSAGLSFLLEMLESDTSTKFLSKPRILCQDREWAEIKITANQIVSIKTTVTETTTETEVERMEVGTILRIVPLINEEEGFVSLLLEPSISRPKDSPFTAPAAMGGANYVDPQKRSMRTTVMIRDGDTVAVGGFITTEDQESSTKVPWLGDIPLFGMFFRHKSIDRIDKELMIFITPKIIRPTDRMEMWVDNVSTGGEQSMAAKPVEKEDKSEKLIEKLKIESKAKQEPVAIKPQPVKALPFREQDDLKLDLTMQSPGMIGVDLLK